MPHTEQPKFVKLRRRMIAETETFLNQNVPGRPHFLGPEAGPARARLAAASLVEESEPDRAARVSGSAAHGSAQRRLDGGPRAPKLRFDQ
jgi:hypothetical protein